MNRIFYICSALLLSVGSAVSLGITTDYTQKPAAVCTINDGLVWDYELAAVFNPGKGRRIAVLDFCHSGGFVGDLSTRPLSYVTSACDWDEYAFTGFGQDFMNESKTKTLHQSFLTAFDNNKIREKPLEGGDLGSAELNYLSGDRAILFSAGGDPSFWKDITTARSALTSRTNLPWPDQPEKPVNAISAYYDNGGGAPWVEGPATRDNLLNSITTARDSMGDLSNLFLYLDDHGTSTDVVKSRVNGRKYEYQTNVSLWRGGTDDDNPYGIWKVRHKLIDTVEAHYPIIHFDHPDWEGKVVGDWMEYYSTKKDDRSTWLLPGVDYDFGYTYYMDPITGHVDWEDWSTLKYKGKYRRNDWGRVDIDPATGSERDNLGKGWFVWKQDHTGAVDPERWTGWENGGDGWVLAPSGPIPEPLTFIGVFLGVCGLGRYVRRRRLA